jgi:hypothetical protein
VVYKLGLASQTVTGASTLGLVVRFMASYMLEYLGCLAATGDSMRGLNLSSMGGSPAIRDKRSAWRICARAQYDGRT